MRFGFVTCVQLGLSCMEEIYAVGGRLDLAITLTDGQAVKKSGRVYLDGFCGRHGIPLVKTRNVNDPEAVSAIVAERIDWLFIIGWSQIARREALDAPSRGALGMHPTLLPEGRGRAAIPWAILKGLDRTGVTLFQLDEGVDTGPILAQEALPIAGNETAASLYARVNEAHRTLIRRIWADLDADRIRPCPQDPSAGSVWPGRKPEDGLISPCMKVQEVERLVRAVTHPYPGAFWNEEGAILRVWAGRPAAGDGGSAAHPRLKLADGWYEALEWTRE